MKGTVKWFNNQKGYGFISDAEGHDVFVHYSGLNMDGFKELNREQASVFINIFYENSAKQWYQYQQTTVGSSSFIDTEEGDWEDVDVGQWTGAYNSKGDTGNLWWFDYNYAYQLQGDLSKEEMIEIAESLVREK